MQKIIKMTFAFCISVILMSSVTAARTCSTSEQAELNTLVSNIKGTYQEMEEPLDPNEYTSPGAEEKIDPEENGNQEDFEEPTVDTITSLSYFDISITNITSKVYIVVTNDYNDDENTYYYTDAKDGIITFSWKNLDAVSTFTIKVYSSNNTGCPNELQRTITVRTPRYNEYYETAICEKYPDFNLCQKFVTFDYVDGNAFRNRLDAYLKTKKDKISEQENVEKSTLDKIKDFVIDHKYYFIAGGVVVLIGMGVAVAVIVKKRRSSEL